MAERPESRGAAEVAAGLGALVSVVTEARRQTGLVRALRVLGRANQKHGFDCPGCAWPDPKERSFAEFCENGAKAILDEATTKRVDRDFFARHSLDEIRTIPERELNDRGRLARPFVKRRGANHFSEATYDEALTLLAEELSKLDEPDRAAFYTSGRASNEAAFLYQLLARRLGTNNLPDCSNLCHESSGVALKESIGIGKGTVRLDDFLVADLILVVGQNPGSNHPRMLSTLVAARERGATIVSINPLVEPGFKRFAHPQHPEDLVTEGKPVADHFVRVAIGGDQALFRGLSKVLLERENPVVDEGFVERFTEGFAAYRKAVLETEWSSIERLSGLSRAEVESLGATCASAKNVICTWAMGLTQHTHAVVAIQEIVNFLLLGGHIGRPGAGVCPVRGHSNVQGDRSMGIATVLDEERSKALESRFEFPVPREKGLDSVGTIEAMRAGRVTHFVSLGGNFLSACPDTSVTADALGKTHLAAFVTTKLNHSHFASNGAIVLLPCLGRSEIDSIGGKDQLVSVENSMGIVSASRGRQGGPEGVLGEPRIIAELGALLEARAKTRTAIPWSEFARDYDSIRESIETVVPGFAGFREHFENGFELPNGPRNGVFRGKLGRALFVTSPLTKLEAREGELVLSTLRSHDQFNTTVYSDRDRYRGITGRRVILLHPDDLAARGLQSGSPIHIESYFEDENGAASVRRLEDFTALPYDTRRGEAFAYFPETNPLFFLDSFAEKSRTPTSKAVRIRLFPACPLDQKELEGG